MSHNDNNNDNNHNDNNNNPDQNKQLPYVNEPIETFDEKIESLTREEEYKEETRQMELEQNNWLVKTRGELSPGDEASLLELFKTANASSGTAVAILPKLVLSVRQVFPKWTDTQIAQYIASYLHKWSIGTVFRFVTGMDGQQKQQEQQHQQERRYQQKTPEEIGNILGTALHEASRSRATAGILLPPLVQKVRDAYPDWTNTMIAEYISEQIGRWTASTIVKFVPRSTTGNSVRPRNPALPRFESIEEQPTQEQQQPQQHDNSLLLKARFCPWCGSPIKSG